MKLFNAICYYRDYHKVNSGKKYGEGIRKHPCQIFRVFWRY